MMVCLVAALAGAGAEGFCLSVFFLVWMMRIAISVATRWLETDPDTVIYFAPWVREFCTPFNIADSKCGSELNLPELGNETSKWSMRCA